MNALAANTVLGESRMTPWATRAVDRYLRHAIARRRPRAFVVAGQPGAGKGPIVEEICRLLATRGSSVVIDSEELKYLHPAYAQLSSDDDRTVIPAIAAEIQGLTSQLLNQALRRRAHLILETPLADPHAATAIVGKLKEASYHITIIALCVPLEVSWQGTLERRTRQQKQFGVAAFVSRSTHDACCRTLVDSLEALEHQRFVDELCILTRDGQRLVAMKTGPGWTLGASRQAFANYASPPEGGQPDSPAEQAVREVAAVGGRKIKIGLFTKPQDEAPAVGSPEVGSDPDSKTPGDRPRPTSADGTRASRRIRLGTFGHDPLPPLSRTSSYEQTASPSPAYRESLGPSTTESAARLPQGNPLQKPSPRRRPAPVDAASISQRDRQQPAFPAQEAVSTSAVDQAASSSDEPTAPIEDGAGEESIVDSPAVQRRIQLQRKIRNRADGRD